MQLPPTVLSEDSSSSPKSVKAPSKAKDADENHVNKEPTKKDLNVKKSEMVLKKPTSLATTLFERLVDLHGNKIRSLLQIQYR